jgi:Asp-tRNA(Asn)/Glu-tRNA(Gln) amidotransferase A subunit family amidase
MVPFALGSQTLGSVIRPASFCGVTGFKPSYGLLSLEGVLPLSRSLDHAGFFTRTAEEMAFLWEALRGERAEPRLERLTALKWPLEGKLEPAMEQGFEECLERLRAGGIALDWAAEPKSFEELPRAVLTVEAYEAARLHRERYAEHGEALGRKLAELFEAGLALSESEYVAAKNALATARQEYEAWSKEHPVTATPAALGAAPAGLESTGDPRANAPWTALGAPALTVPFGRDGEGLPLGLQLTAPAGRDGSVLGAGLVCERVLGRLR